MRAWRWDINSRELMFAEKLEETPGCTQAGKCCVRTQWEGDTGNPGREPAEKVKHFEHWPQISGLQTTHGLWSFTVAVLAD
jgi:hypothetical protein